MGTKITIGAARNSGAEALIAYCQGAPATTGGCTHNSKITIMHALVLWGPEARLDDLRLRCSACGSRLVDVRPDYPYRSSGPWNPNAT